MKKRKSTALRVLAVLMTMAMLLVNPAIQISVVAIGEGIGTLISEAYARNRLLASGGPTDLEQIEPPEVTENPYNIEGNKYILPVYNTRNYESLKLGTQLLTSYGHFRNRTPERSQYHTGSVLLYGEWTDYNGGKASITSELPYNEVNTKMFHPELTLQSTNTSGRLDGILYASALDAITPDGSSIWNYLDESHTKMIIGGRLIQGRGEIYVSERTKDGETVTDYDQFGTVKVRPGVYETENLKKGETYFFETELPFNSNTDFYKILFSSSSNSIITDPHAAIIDDSDPYIKDAEITMEKGLRDDESDLILTLTLNEGIRLISSYDLEDAKNTYVIARLWNATARKSQTVRLYLSNVDGTNKVEFRGNLGKLHYVDFSLSEIYNPVPNPGRKAGRMIDVGTIDLVDQMVVGAGNVMEYNHGLRTATNACMSQMSWQQGVLCDHAGNDLWLGTLSSMDIRFENRVGSIESEDIRIYNDKTLGVESGKISTTDVVDTDMFVGPGIDMTVQIKLNRTVDKELWKQIYIKLNILDKDGNELKLYPVSAKKYSDNEVYADGVKKGMMLTFRTKLYSSMSLAVAEGEEPRVLVTSMGSDYDPNETGLPPVYPYTEEPTNIMYADFTAPTVEVRKIAGTDAGEGEYHKVSIEVKAEDKTVYARAAGLIGSRAYVSIGGGVEKETKAKYVLSTDPIPPEDASAYINELTLVPDALVAVGGLTIVNDVSAVYVHMIIENGEIYLNQFEVSVLLADMANNELVLKPGEKIEHIIDKIPPTVAITGKNAAAEDGNTTIKLSVNVKADDHSDVQRVLYCFGGEMLNGSEEWQAALIGEFGTSINAVIERKYGSADDPASAENRTYEETIWVKAVDAYGNESEPVSTEVVLSLEKPDTVVTYTGDPNEVSREHKVLVSGPEATVIEGVQTPAYTRVTLTPEGAVYSYATIVGTGEKDVDVLALKGLDWYRVQIVDGNYAQVIGPLTVEEDTAGLLAELVNCYGELKVSFESGYGDMTPKVGSVSQTAAEGSYFADPNYYTLRYASPLIEGQTTHGVDFGAIVDFALPFNSQELVIKTGGTPVVPDADKGAAPYVFNQQYKGVNPMRNAQIHFTISNIANSKYGILDVDFENSYAELMKVSAEGEDTAVAKQQGLWATESQYFTVNNTMDDGEYFTTGAYYLKVTVVDGGGEHSVYESSRIVLDAQNADNAGLWEYSYKSVADITNTDEKTEVIKTAGEEAFEDIGFAVLAGGEMGRDRNFAVYSYGTEDIKLTLSVPNSELTVEGITVGEVEGFKIWNLLSNPTDAEIAARRFELTDGTDTLQRTVKTSWIRSSETIPTGISGMTALYLIKGTNTICYQVKLKNGYVSPVRQFTVTVTDEAPELSIAIDSYQPSVKPSDVPGVTNVDHIRYYIDTAYSLNGSGNVNVDLWSRYAMNLGLWGENGEINEGFTEDPLGNLEVVKSGMKVEEYADFTENSYTANFPHTSVAWCTAAFVATDEYGGITIVAPQIGNMERINVDAGTIGNAHEIDISYYAPYFDDPYMSDTQFSWRRIYHQPTYFGARLLSFETYLEENAEDEKKTVLYTHDTDLRYNNFNIETNDISLGNGASYGTATGQGVYFENRKNQELVLLPSAKVTLSGGYIENPVTVDFISGDVITLDENGIPQLGEGNTVGYAYGYSNYNNDGTPSSLMFFMASPPADAEHVAGSTVDITYTLEYMNFYGDKYTKTGIVTLTYVDYKIESAEMTESGAKLNFNFEPKDVTNAGVDRTGKFNNGTYEATVSDYYGRTQTYQYTVDDQTDVKTSITYEKHTNTSMPVKITLRGAHKILVDITDYAVMDVEYGEGVTIVTVKDNTRFSYRYVDSNGDENMYYITVDNIFALDPKTVYAQDIEKYHTDDDGTKYLYGDVTVYLTDNNFIIIDKYTGKLPSYTFTPGGPDHYTFSKNDVVALLGDETVELTEDITVVLGVKLYELPTAETAAEDDTETPNVQIKAYSKIGEAYSEDRVALKLTNTRNSTAILSEYGYHTFEYVGGRANMSEVLGRLGWSTAYRFTVETVDSSRVRLFVKEGLYTEAPDYETGKSDRIDGVELNSKLLTVTKNAKFTLFVVDRSNNSSAIAFNVTNISEAPIPKIVKIPMGHDKVRVYVIAPDGVAEEDLAINTPTLTTQTDTDPESVYYLKKYVEISANDEYEILYEIKYNGVPVQDAIDVSVTEISLDEITMKSLEWSANKAKEATAGTVSADILFSHRVAAISAVTAYDPAKVSFITAGNTVKVTYTDNHPAITFNVMAENGTYVEVTLDSVENIDKTAPEITIGSETLAKNGKSLTLVLISNERATFKEGYGRVGEAVTDGDGNTFYHYTVTLTQNGEYSFTFSNMSGIQTVFEYTLTELVLDKLEVLYNTSPADDGTKNDPDGMELEVGSTVYIKPLRDVSAAITGMEAPIEINGGEWYELKIPATAGGIPPYVIYTDTYGNTLTHQFAKVEIPDTTAPEIVISKYTYPVRVGTSREDIEAELMANFAAFDDKDATVTLEVEFTDDVSIIGLTDVKYKATDSVGNTAVSYGKLRITSIYEPVVYVGEKRVIREEGINLRSGEEITLSIDTQGVAYKVILATGKRTAAQLKGREALADYSTAETAELGALNDGIYTVLIVTEQRDYFRILIAVEDY